MDAESLAQIGQIVTTAVSGAEGGLRKEMETLGASLRQEFGEQTQTLTASLRQELGEKTETLAASLRQEFREGIEEVKRHSGVLYEDVLRRIDLVVEGHQGLREGLRALGEQVSALDVKIERESLETRALIQLSYRQLQDRVETLEQRVHIIEKRLGLSA